jgi:hypothetical protein
MRTRDKRVNPGSQPKPKPVAIIACTKQKRRGTWPAVQLYDTSELFRESVRTAQADGLPILVLSTKYGLVEAHESLAW